MILLPVLLAILIGLPIISSSKTSTGKFQATGATIGQNKWLTENDFSFDLTQKLNSIVLLKIQFIGFENSTINLSALEGQLYNSIGHPKDPPLEDVNFAFEFSFTAEDKTNALKDYITSIAVNGTNTGYDLDIDLLLEDLNSGNRSNIFIPRDGMSINAELVEDYLYQHLYQEPVSETSYTFFIANFSEFDSTDHSYEHWYDTSGIDLDSEEPITWWYSGYGNLSKRAAMGWGGNYRFCYLDVSARSWYLDYVKTAWTALGGGGSELYYQFPDLDNLTQTFDPHTTEGQAKIGQYLSDWINSYIGNVFSKPVSSKVCIYQTVSVQVKVFENLTDNGFALEDISWCINQSKIFNQLQSDLPWINFDVKVEWAKLSDYPDLFDYLQSRIEEDIDGKYIEIWPELFYYLSNHRSDYFDLETAEFVLPCYFFITNDVGFRYGGISFAGLGGMGWEILLATQNSLFENGQLDQPRRGMSQVMIHELGHSLGLPHPHSGTFGWGSSFVADVMSYFAMEPGYSTFYRDAIGCAQTEANFNYALAEFETALQLYSDAGEPQALNDLIMQIYDDLTVIPTYYKQMDYNQSATRVFLVREQLQQLFDALRSTESASETLTSTSYFGISLVIVLPVLILTKKVLSRKKDVN